MLIHTQTHTDKSSDTFGRYTDEGPFFIARFSNTSDFLAKKKYGDCA